jgi:lincosamide nucleotidyltransferase A/C/D/E
MQAEDVIALYLELKRVGVGIWIDGGWAVDAVVGRQTRPHNDLDIAVEARFLPALRRVLERRGYRESATADTTAWNFLLADHAGRKVDVHAVVLDVRHGVFADAVDGIAYPAGSLTGEGVIAGGRVRCISAEFQLKFKTSYPPRETDRADVALLCALLGQKAPETHR